MIVCMGQVLEWGLQGGVAYGVCASLIAGLQYSTHISLHPSGVRTDNDFDEEESETFQTIRSKCLTNLTASKEAMWDLSGYHFGDLDVSAIVKALDGNTTVTSLDLSNNRFTEIGLKEIAKMMETNSTIAKIDLSGARALDVDENNT